MTFFVACPVHCVLLVRDCPGCGKSLSPHRAVLDRCNCGFAFAEAKTELAPIEAVWAAQLIQRYVSEGPQYQVKPPPTTAYTTDRLAALGLDALFKTFWFFGRYLSEDYCVPVSRARPGAGQVVQLVRKTIQILDGWPDSFLQHLEERMRGYDPLCISRPEKALAPLRNYLEQELDNEGQAFIHAAYDRFLRDAWRNRAYDAYRKSRITQMELF